MVATSFHHLGRLQLLNSLRSLLCYFVLFNVQHIFMLFHAVPPEGVKIASILLIVSQVVDAKYVLKAVVLILLDYLHYFYCTICACESLVLFILMALSPTTNFPMNLFTCGMFQSGVYKYSLSSSVFCCPLSPLV